MQDLAHIINKLPIGVWVAAVPSGEAVYANEAFDAILGKPAVPSSVIEDAPSTYGIYDRAGRLYPFERLPFSRVVQTGEAVVVDDLVIHRPDSRRINVRAFAHPVFDEARRIRWVSIAFIDITREAQAEVERDRAAARLTLAVDHSPLVIWTTDERGTITLSQGAALKALGFKSGELVGRNVLELYQDNPVITDYLRRALRGEPLHYEVEVGDAIFDTWLTPLRNDAGQVVGLTGLGHDVRELRRLRAAGVQADRAAALGTLAASVAHEINNPLTYILSHASSIDTTLEELERVSSSVSHAAAAEIRTLIARLHADFQTLRSGTERIATITRELRTFSHPDDQSVGPVDARAAALSVLQLIGKELEGRARLSLDLRETAPLLGQQTRLVQVILNLVMNAKQSLPSKPSEQNTIYLATRTEGSNVIVEVGDTGPGVAPRDRERIFEPFVTTKPVGEGSGLGLFVCRNIVRGFSGEVTVHDRPGGGALFRVSLPVPEHVAPVEPAPLSEPPKAPPPRAHVIIIDDDTRVASALSGLLGRAGYRTTTYASAAAALERLVQGNDIDLVFCDLMMKDMTGMDLYARLIERAPDLVERVVFMTGGAYSASARQFLRERPEDMVVEKPFDIVGETRRRLRRRSELMADGRASPRS